MEYQELTSISTMETGRRAYGTVQTNLVSVEAPPESLLQELLLTIQNGDSTHLRVLLPDNVHPSTISREALDHLYHNDEVQGALLHVATRDNVPELVKILINHGADPNVRDVSGSKYSPLHYAAEEGYPTIVELLLQAGANPNARESGNGRTPLHLLLRKWKTRTDDFKSCLDFLLEHTKINVNIQDDKKATPLFLACKKEWEYMAKALILRGANLNQIVRDNLTEAQHVQIQFPDLIDSIVKNLSEIPTKRHYGDDLLDEGIKKNDFEKFKQILLDIDTSNEDKTKIIEEDYGKTLLQSSCNNGQSHFVKELLKHGADPLKQDRTNFNSPLLYASRKGYYKIIEILLNEMEKCNKLIDGLNQVDQICETSLHKVVKREFKVKEGEEERDYEKSLNVLLKYKSLINIDALNEFGNTALHYAVLWDDKTFVRLLLLNGAHWGIKNTSGNIPITNIKAALLEEILDECIKLNSDELDKFEIILSYCMLVPAHNNQKTETERLKYLSESKRHQHLLVHPIINTFLCLKWQRIEPYYYINIAAYSIYLLLLTFYIVLFHSSFYGNYILLNNNTSNLNSSIVFDDMKNSSMTDFALKLCMQVFIAVFTFYIAIREVVQFCVSWKLYISRIENWLEISIVSLTFVLFLPISPYTKQSISAWLILFSWTEFVLLLGCHPLLAVYITMFTKVAYNFLKFILMFSFMIFAFSLSFYLIFQVNEQFMTYHQSLLRTFVMSTGELEYTDLPLSTFPVSSHIIFILFVFLIVLVLMNLLNGLAVSDIQQIQKEAEIVSYKSRVELISYLESVFLVGNCSLPQCRLSSDCCGGSGNNPVSKLLKWLGPKTLMLRDCLNNQCIKMFPNRGKGKFWEVCKCHSSHLERSHIDAAMAVVQASSHRMVDNLAELKEHMSNMDCTISTMDKAINRLTHMVENHVLCPSPTPPTSQTLSRSSKKPLPDVE
ncbi:unnamed protein product [Meganyctiphanes norvegica]|uniref:Ion transport domain-containing protein n=1 Tax=Meganyctiphanes norvegica TaxID=48144 RepID=A0AAV2RTN9_MEGNR